ncbi:hypothetical protein LNJ08_12250 [Tenacibaculum finnmarkense genomovar ulcerans]|uniref:hypothetical protein n=1 Tax=Tenacibaculum finnmarkense TaxID=2781243 RepID=UPI001E5DEC7C|nr:hypothetical protein [Tenacibaculum finnmarkense]MCD8455161.1 hypothetical protein [Tenacibaculum finnmarkense genomovar ulcerans]
MKNIDFNKDKISIKNIGTPRFWVGIIIGFITSLLISITFNKTREIIRFLSSISQDILTFEKQELIFFNYFFSSLSTVLGLSITILIWMGNRTQQRIRVKLYKQQSRTNNLLFFWLILFLITQIGSIFLFFSLGGISSHDYPISLYKDHWILFALIPFVIFIQNWYLVRLTYKSGKWILISFFSSVITTLILYQTTTVNQDILNETYFQRHKKKYEYIEKESIKLEKEYGKKYNTETIEILKERGTSNSILQVRNVKRALSINKKVSIDTIILQKIIIHNIKKGNWHLSYYESNQLRNWGYALPKDILKQISYFDSNSNETKELFEVLRESINLVNKSKIEVNYSEKNSKFEVINNNNYLDTNINLLLIKQMNQVRDSLLKMKKYSELNKTLPEITLTKKTYPNNGYN